MKPMTVGLRVTTGGRDQAHDFIGRALCGLELF